MRAPARIGMLVVLAQFFCAQLAWGQAGFDDDRVMLQGFYWESYRHGDPDHPEFADKKWYAMVREQAAVLRDARFDLVWLPPPSWAGKGSAGYNPKQYFRLDNSYGDWAQHRAMLEELLQHGVEPVADIVINHRDGTHSWADFENPRWDLSSICSSDESFYRNESPVKDTPMSQRGSPEEKPAEYTMHGGSTYQYGDFRDLDHTNRVVRKDIIRYLLQLKSAGYRGWRYDMVHGYHARHLALYNQRSQPTFSVGEYEWDQQPSQRGWVWHTAVDPAPAGADHLRTSSSVFDFSTQFALKDNKANYRAWYGLGGGGLGLVGDTTDDLPWKHRAVTFLENHDTGYRTNSDGTPQQHHEHDSFANNWEVEQAYAFLLTHPGVPTVYWKHYFDWGRDLRERIKALINARKAAAVHAGSPVHLQNNARDRGVYAARVDGRRGELYVRIGGSDNDWSPYHSDYRDYREYARGAGWKVWVKLPGNPAVQWADAKGPLPVPTYRSADQIEVPDSWADP
jgi:alpha-amylase